MKRIYFYWVIFAEIVGGLSGFLTREGMKIYADSAVKPFLSPPAIVFPVAWTILYALMGIGAARVYASPKSPDRTKGLLMFVLQLGINFAWCFVFFMFRKYLAAFVVLVALLISVGYMAILFRKVDKLSGYLQVPYIFWLIFAGYLNLAVWYLNA
ncbi:MAG: tryptophan-rich sensory protein [Synergistaceae bacterium]|nr:tryptophan-rich sensory protein [Synergistaceae bacterium]